LALSRRNPVRRSGVNSTPRHTLPIVAVIAAALLVAVARSDEAGRAAPAPLSGAAIPGAISGAIPGRDGSLTISIEGLRETRGTVLVGLYDSAASFERAIRLAGDEGFLNDPERVAGAALRANDKRHAAVRFENLPPGRYAVILFHDENGNGKLDKNFWGVPIEPYGFSNDAQGTLGPPGFADAALTLDGGDRTIRISLVYHGGGLATAPLDDDPAPLSPSPSPVDRPALGSSALPAGDPSHF
jgi:uncharacterized protein (DUF2141 family)